MKKKVLWMILLMIIAIGALSSSNYLNKQTKTTCPDKPGCICSKPEISDKPIAKKHCPNTPDCICE